MKKLSTRILAFLLTLAMVLSYVPGVAQTARAVEEETTPVVETAPEETAEPVSEKEEPTEAAEPEVEETTEVTAPAEEEAPADEELIGETVAFDEVVVYAADPDFDTKISGLSGTYTEPSNDKNPGTVEITAEMNEQSGKGSIEIQLQGYYNGTRAYYENTTVTLTNTTDSEYILAFDYDAAVSQKNKNEFVKLDGVEIAGYTTNGSPKSGSVTKTLQPGKSVVIEMAVYNRSVQNSASIKLKNIAFAKNADVTTKFLKAENGTYTVSYGDTTVTITEDTEITNKLNVGYKLAATPAEGYAFAGWYDYNKNIYVGGGAISENVSFTDETAVAQVAPLFVKTADAVYGVGEACFMDYETAINYAMNSEDKIVALLKDVTWTSGTYEVPEGITLLVPFDDKNTCYTENPGTTSSKDNKVAWVTPYAYRTLTLESGAELVVKGYVSISAKHSAGPEATAGSPTGPFGHVVMADNSKITLEKDAALYAWGYITGSGDVIAKSGSEVWENIQIADFRGGGASVTMVPTKADDPLIEEKKVFPFSQYYVQNIEVALTIYSGASEKVSSTLYALDDTYPTPGIEFIGGDTAMFQLGEGSYIVKDYDNTTDRLNLSAHGTGNMSVNSLSVEMAGTGLNSSMFNLPITSNITINAMGGNTTINQDVALMPGSEVYIAKGATLTMGSGYNVFVYDLDDWSKGTAHVLVGMDGETPVYDLKPVTGCNFVHNNVKVRPVAFSPAGKATRTANSLVDAKVDVNGTLNVEGFLYTTSGGANITSSKGTGKIWMNSVEIGSADHTNQVTQSGTDVTYVDIAITPAKLKNADGSFTESNSIAPMSVFYYENGKWVGKNSYTVTFDGNGAEGTVDPVEVTFIEVYWEENFIELPENAFTMKYGEFLGWDTDKDAEKPWYLEGDKFEVTEDVTLYAIWKITPPASHTITWVIDGKSTETSWYEGETPVYNGETPTKAADGCTTYTFAGWATSADGDVLETIPAATDAATYYAIFTAATNHSFTTKPGSVKTPGNCQTEAVHYVQCDNCDAESTQTVKGKKDKNNHVTPDNFTYADHRGSHEKNYACCGTLAAWEVCTYNDHFVPIDQGGRHRAYCICGGYYIQDHTLQEDNYCKCGAFATYLDFNGGKNNADPSLTGMYEWWDPMFGKDNRYNLSEENLDKINSNFSKDGYRIIGYAYDAEGTNMYVSEAPITGPTTLYMIWECVHETTKAVDNNDGETHNLICANPECNAVLDENVAHDYSKNDEHKCECGAVEMVTIAFYAESNPTDFSIQVPYGTVLTEEHMAVLDAYEVPEGTKLIGWFANGVEVKAGYVATNDTKAHAYLETLKYTVTWVANGETVATETVEYGKNATKTPAVPAKEGHTGAWDKTATNVKSDLTINAVYTINAYNYKIERYEMNLSGYYELKSTETKTADYGTEIDLTGITVPTGFRLDGENADSKLKATVPANNTLVMKVFLARKTVVINVNWNGELLQNLYNYYGATVQIPTGTTPEGHTFLGYAKSEGGEVFIPAADLSKAYTMTESMDLYAVFEVNTYTVTFTINGETYGEPVEVKFGEAINAPEYTVPTGYTFSGWTLPETMPAEDITLDATVEVNMYTLEIDAMKFGGEGHGYSTINVNVPYGAKLADYIPVGVYQPGDTVSVNGNKFKGTWIITGWNSWSEEDGYQTIDIATATMPVNGITITQSFNFTGWKIDDKGSKYAINYLHNQYYKDTIAHIDGEAYLFDENGYIVAGAGLVRFVTEDGTVEYYYFCDGYCEDSDEACKFREPSYTAFKEGVHWVYNDNDLLPNWDYTFDDRGVILHHQDTSLNGLHDQGEDTIYYTDGVPVYMGLMYNQEEDYYYYIRSSGKMVKSQTYWISKTNGLPVEEKAYLFDADGHMYLKDPNLKNGIIAENGGLYYYVDGKLTYAGLIEIDGDLYYVRSNGQLVQSQKYWISKTNGLKPEGSYHFDAEGKLYIPEPVVEIVDGYYYVDGKLTYAGLIEIDGDLYYVRSNGQLVKGQWYWVSKTNGLKPEGSYEFDAEGRLIEDEDRFTGIKDGYYYVNGVKTYAGLVEIDGELYYINSSCQVVTGRKYWISKTNGLKPEGSYTFDATGKLIG